MFNYNFSSFRSIFRCNYRAFTRQVCAFLACSPFQKYCYLKSNILKLFSYVKCAQEWKGKDKFGMRQFFPMNISKGVCHDQAF